MFMMLIWQAKLLEANKLVQKRIRVSSNGRNISVYGEDKDNLHIILLIMRFNDQSVCIISPGVLNFSVPILIIFSIVIFVIVKTQRKVSRQYGFL